MPSSSTHPPTPDHGARPSHHPRAPTTGHHHAPPAPATTTHCPPRRHPPTASPCLKDPARIHLAVPQHPPSGLLSIGIQPSLPPHLFPPMLHCSLSVAPVLYHDATLSSSSIPFLPQPSTARTQRWILNLLHFPPPMHAPVSIDAPVTSHPTPGSPSDEILLDHPPTCAFKRMVAGVVPDLVPRCPARVLHRHGPSYW